MGAGSRGGDSYTTNWRKAHPEAYEREKAGKKRAYRKRNPDAVRDTETHTETAAEVAKVPRKDWAATLIKWAAETLTIPSGMLAGKPFVFEDWQQEWLHAALAPGLRVSCQSVGRKNAKTGQAAVIALAFLAGPLNFPGWRGATCSLTGRHAKELAHALVGTAEASGLGHTVKYLVSPAPGRVVGLNGAELQVLAADKAGGESLSNDLAILDEIGLYDADKKRELVYGLRSSLSARDGLMLCISVRGDSELFSEFAKIAPEDSSIFWREWAAPEHCALDDPAAWKAANPGLGSIKSLAYMQESARMALALPAYENEFASRDLNLPRSPNVEPIIGAAAWQKCLVSRAKMPPREGPCVLGFDAGASASMTAAAALWSNDRLEVWAGFPASVSLRRRGRMDNVGSLYETMSNRGELRIFGGMATPIEPFLEWVRDELGDTTIAAFGCDRYRQKELVSALQEILPGTPQAWRGTGASTTADGSHDVRAFQQACQKGRLFTDNKALLMTAAVAKSKLRYDSAGNPALDKITAKARIDSLQAAVIACGLRSLGYCEITGARFLT